MTSDTLTGISRDTAYIAKHLAANRPVREDARVAATA
jgi:hypothetical protein